MHHTVFFDLETNSLDTSEANIVQATVLDADGAVLVNQYAYPPIGLTTGCVAVHGIDVPKLEATEAVVSTDLPAIIVEAVRRRYGAKEPVHFVAYNNFGYDQSVLEFGFLKAGVCMPANWQFTDVLPLLREKSLPVRNHKLATIYEYLMRATKQWCPATDENLAYHDALTDTLCTRKVYRVCSKVPMERYTRPRLGSLDILDSPVMVLSGCTERMRAALATGGWHTVGDLMAQFQLLRHALSEMRRWIHCNGEPSCRFETENMAGQLATIHLLHSTQLRPRKCPKQSLPPPLLPLKT
jgi:hypothetical protein